MRQWESDNGPGGPATGRARTRREAEKGLLHRWKRALVRRLHGKIVRHRLAPFVARHQTADRVIDLGCGGSRYAIHYPNRIGVDIRLKPGVSVVADAHDLPFRRECVSTVLCTEMLEHATVPQRVVDQVRQILRPSGRLLLTTRFLYPIHDAPHDYFRFTHFGLRHLFRDWACCQITAETRPFESLAVLLQVMSFQSDLRGGPVARWLLLLTARLVPLADGLVKRQYGDYHRTTDEPAALTSGYHLVATKGVERGGRSR